VSWITWRIPCASEILWVSPIPSLFTNASAASFGASTGLLRTLRNERQVVLHLWQGHAGPLVAQGTEKPRGGAKRCRRGIRNINGLAGKMVISMLEFRHRWISEWTSATMSQFKMLLESIGHSCTPTAENVRSKVVLKVGGMCSVSDISTKMVESSARWSARHSRA
jgi:hypothetical protein